MSPLKSSLRGAPLLALILLLAACAGASAHEVPGYNGEPLPWGEPPEEPEAVPGQVRDALPVHPDAGEVPDEAVVGFATQAQGSICLRERCPMVQAARHQYAVDAPEDEIRRWYWEQLTPLGYRESGGGSGISGGNPHSSVDYFHPAQPDVTVQVHFYPQTGGELVVDVLVVYLEPLPKPDGPVIPVDIERVEIDYLPDDSAHEVTDPAIAGRLAHIVNNLPVRPDYVQWGGPIGLEESGATLTFVASDGESWELRIVRPGRPFRVEFGGYPHLQDTRNLLWEAVEEAVDVAEPYEPPAKWPGAPTPPTPMPTAASTPPPATDTAAGEAPDRSGLLWGTSRLFPVSCLPESSGVPCEGGVAVGEVFFYQLYTHCGVRSVYFNGQWWIADPVLGNNNAPQGWGNPDDVGEIQLAAENRVLFRSSTGETAEFRPLAPGEQYEGYPCY